MNKYFNKLIIMISIVLLAIVTVPSALAYFYTYAQTEGTVKVSLSDGSKIKEDFKNQEKQITIVAEDNSDPVFVRVKYIAPSGTVESVTLNDGWVNGSDGYYYYTTPIDGKEGGLPASTATTLNIKIEYPADAEKGDSFSVIVLHEMTPALFSQTEPSAEYKYFDLEKNGWWYADWKTTVEPTTEVDG